MRKRAFYEYTGSPKTSVSRSHCAIWTFSNLHAHGVCGFLGLYPRAIISKMYGESWEPLGFYQTSWVGKRP